MSLDQNLFTLIIAPSKSSPSDTDLSDPFSKVVSYRKSRATRPSAAGTYEWSMYDPYSGARLATVTAPHPSSKKKIITLHDPDVPVEFTLSGTMSPKWSFNFEDFEFDWKKDSCYVVRKPDPPVIVCTTRAETKDKPASVQILDYNVKRFDIDDRKGLEVLLLCGLLTFADYAEGIKEAPKPGNSTPSSAPVSPPPPVVVSNATPTTAPPANAPKLPPRPMYNFTPYAKNEVLVTQEATVQEYAQHSLSLLGDKDLLYITIKSHTADEVTKVVQVSQEIKRLHHREIGDEEELHQYVKYGEAEDIKGKKSRVIKLDDAPTTKKVEYKPPTSLTIHFSKIELPDLMPTKPSTPPAPQPPVDTRFGFRLPVRVKPSFQGLPKLQPPQSDDKTRRHSFSSSPTAANPPRSSSPRTSNYNGDEKHSSQPSAHPQSRPPRAQPRTRPQSSSGEPNRPKLNRKPSPHHHPGTPPGSHDPNESRLPPGGYPQEPTSPEPSKQSMMGRLFGF